MMFEQPSLPVGTLRKTFERKENLAKRVEYRNAQGEKICDAFIRLSPSMEPISSFEKARRILEYKLTFINEAGEKEDLDILGLAQTDGLGVSAYAYEGTPPQNHYSPEKRLVVVTLENSLLDIVKLLHEFGHAEQHVDERVAPLVKHTRLIKQLDRGEDIHSSVLEEIAQNVHVEFSPQDQAVMSACKILDQKIEKFEQEKKGLILLQEKIEEEELDLNASFRKIEKIRAVLKQLEEEIKNSLKEKSDLLNRIQHILRLPKVITERDATARAFKKMHNVRMKNKFDMFVEVPLPESFKNNQEFQYWAKNVRVSDHEECDPFVRAEVPTQNTLDARTYFLRYSLWGYYGRAPELRKKFGSIPKPLEVLNADEDIEEIDPEEMVLEEVAMPSPKSPHSFSKRPPHFTSSKSTQASL